MFALTNDDSDGLDGNYAVFPVIDPVYDSVQTGWNLIAVTGCN